MADIIKYTPDRFLSVEKTTREFAKLNTVEKLLSNLNQTPTLARIKRDYSEDKALALIELRILDINNFFNFKQKMSESQMRETALYILQDFYYLTMAEIIHVFIQAKKGYFGEFYQSLDGSKIMNWFRIYTDERIAFAERRSMELHDRIKYYEEKEDRISGREAKREKKRRGKV